MKIKEKVLKEIDRMTTFQENPMEDCIEITLAEVGKVIDEGNIRSSDFYRKILKHRSMCSKWGKDFCIECFGLGLTKSRESFFKELKQKLGLK